MEGTSPQCSVNMTTESSQEEVVSSVQRTTSRFTAVAGIMEETLLSDTTRLFMGRQQRQWKLLRAPPKSPLTLLSPEYLGLA